MSKPNPLALYQSVEYLKAENAELKDALARAIVILQREFGYTSDEVAQWLFDKTGKEYVVNEDPLSIADEKERIDQAEQALARLRASGHSGSSDSSKPTG